MRKHYFHLLRLSTLLVFVTSCTTITRPSPTPVVSPIPTLSPELAGDSENIQQPDGTTIYIDHNAGFELTLPADWLSVRPGTSEFINSLEREGAKNQALLGQMELDLNYSPDIDRYFIYATKPTELKNSLSAHGKLYWISSDTRPMTQSTLDELLKEREAAEGIPGLQITTSSVVTNMNNIPVIVIVANWVQESSNGTTESPWDLTTIYFNPPENGTALIWIITKDEFRDVIDPDVNAIIQSIKLVGK
jgi:hypothetical protein